MTPLVDCKLWFNFSAIFPFVLALLVAATHLTAMNPSDIRAAWVLGNRMKTVGEVIAFVLSACFLLIWLIGATGIAEVKGFDYGSKSKPMVDQICD